MADFMPKLNAGTEIAKLSCQTARSLDEWERNTSFKIGKYFEPILEP